MSTILDRVRREPALVSGLASAVIALAVSFGLDWTAEQVGAVMAVVAAILAVFTRQQVTPVVDVVEQLETEGLEKFEASWEELLGSVRSELEKAGDNK